MHGERLRTSLETMFLAVLFVNLSTVLTVALKTQYGRLFRMEHLSV